jgi:predicted transcriptional regulator
VQAQRPVKQELSIFVLDAMGRPHQLLARTLSHHYKRVHEDVEALENAGLIQRGAQGLHTGYDEIRARIAL